MSRNSDNRPMFQVIDSPHSQIQQIGEIHLGGSLDSTPTTARSRTTLLFLAADPFSRTRLRLDLEMKAVAESLRAAGLEERLELAHSLAPTFADLQHELLRHRPAILHFSGHGTPEGELTFERQAPRSTRDGLGTGDSRPAAHLGKMLGAIEDLSVRCVVLNACFSETQADAVSAHVGCVIGLSAEVRDSAAIEFARGFYGALAWGQSVRTAFDLGVAQVSSEDDARLYRLIASTDARTVRLVDAVRS